MKESLPSMRKKTESRQRHTIKPQPSSGQTAQRKKSQDDYSAGQERIASMQTAAGNQAVLQMFKRTGAEEDETIQRSASAGDQTKMPLDVQAKMEGALGADFSDVRIHANSSKASAAGALAYTQGTEIHFAPGQYSPDRPDGQHLLGHELAHVVQQKAGRVSPTAQLASGTLLNDNPALEQEADTLGEKAANAPEPGPQAIQRAVDRTGASPTARIGDPLVIQRMPSPAQVKGVLGQPKEHTKIFGKTVKKNSTHYRDFLDKLEAFDQYVDNNEVGTSQSDINNQLTQVMSLYAQVEQVSNQYIQHNKNDDKDKKVVYIRKLKETIPFEKTAVRSSAAEYKSDPNKKRPPWKLLTSASLLQLTDDMSTGATDKGGINSVEFFEVGPGLEGVFKADKDKILSDQDLPQSASDKELDAAFAETIVARQAGIDRSDARLANRNVAMSRLDQLLGAGVIARAQFALHNTGSGIVKGSYMEKAKGEAAKSILPQLQDEIEGGKAESFDVNDPAFQRAMSRLQLIDTLSMQVDRHIGNFFITRDDSGKVLGVTGIDNDMAFGTETDINVKHNEYPGLSRFVDKELAERILALQPSDLTSIMDGLLSDAEIAALIERLQKLQEHLKQKSTKLLDKDEWSQVDAKARDKDASYSSGIDKPLAASRAKAERNKAKQTTGK